MGFAALRVWLGVDPDNTHKPTEDGPLCIVCASPSVGGYRVPCQHRDWWCGDCLTASIQVASGSVTDPSAFPPRCHGVPIFPTLHFGLSHDHAVFRSLPVGTREAAIRNWALALSRAAEHEQGQGSIDAELVRTILSSGRAEYQFCPRQSCHRLISRVDGCNHMTCHCGQEFCYVCGAIYDGFFTCGHTHYGHDDWRLRLPRALRGSLATSAPPAPAPPANLARLEPYPAPPAEPNHLELMMMCDHRADFWARLRFRRDNPAFRHASLECYRCGMQLRHFGFECAGCEALVCCACKNALQEGTG